MSGKPASHDLWFLFVMEGLSGLSRGAYLVGLGWSTLVVTDDVGRVGQVFIMAMLTSLLGGPLIGTLVDRQNRKYLVIMAHLGLAATLAFLALVWLRSETPLVGVLFLAVVIATALRMVHHTAHDGLLQALVAPDDLIRFVARFRGVHLVATVFGTIAAGVVIERVSPAAGFLLSGLCSLALVIPALFVRAGRIGTRARGFAAFLDDLRGGIRIFAENRDLRVLALLAAVSLPVGQLSNAILSSLIRDDLGQGSRAFGIVDAAWPLGGMLAAMLLSLGSARFSAKGAEYGFALLAGLATIGMAFSTTIPALFLFHCAMGLTVWLCRIVIDGRILKTCQPENLGRTKVGIEMLFSLSALVMCLSPTLVALPQTAGYFLFWGSVMALVSTLLWAVGRAPLKTL